MRAQDLNGTHLGKRICVNRGAPFMLGTVTQMHDFTIVTTPGGMKKTLLSSDLVEVLPDTEKVAVKDLTYRHLGRKVVGRGILRSITAEYIITARGVLTVTPDNTLELEVE